MDLRAAHQCLVWVSPDLLRQRLVLLLGDVWRVADDEVHFPGQLRWQRVEEVTVANLDVEVQTGCVVAGELEGLRRGVGGHHPRVRPPVLDDQRDRSRSCTHVHDCRRRDPLHPFKRRKRQSFGLWTRDEDPRGHPEHQLQELLVARQVLNGGSMAALAESPAEQASGTSVQSLGPGIQSGSVRLQEVLEQDLRRLPGAVHAVARQVIGGSPDHLGWTHHLPCRRGSALPARFPPEASASCSRRSAAMSAVTSSSMSPAMTSGRLCRDSFSRWSVTRFWGKLYVRIFSERSPVPTCALRAAASSRCCSSWAILSNRDRRYRRAFSLFCRWERSS